MAPSKIYGLQVERHTNNKERGQRRGCFGFVWGLFGFHLGPYWQSGDAFEVILRIMFLNAYIHVFTLNTVLSKQVLPADPLETMCLMKHADTWLALPRLLASIPSGLDTGTLTKGREGMTKGQTHVKSGS